MTAYLFFLCLCSFFLLLSYYLKSNKIIIGFYIVVIFFAGFRINVGVDYDYYYEWFYSKSRDADIELGFLFLMNIFRNYLGNNFYFFIFFITLTTDSIFFFVINKLSTCIPITLFFLILYPPLFLASLTFIRQFLSIALFCLIFYYIKKKKTFVLFAILSISLHYSAIFSYVILFTLFLFKNKYKIIYNYMWLPLVSSLLYNFIFSFQLIDFFKIPIDNYYFSFYIKDENPISYFNLIYINAFAIYVLFKSKYLHNNTNFYFLTFIIIEAVVSNVFSYNKDILRILYYFKIFEIVLLTNIIYKFAKAKCIVFILISMIFSFSFQRSLLTSLNENKKGTKLLPYNNLFLKDYEN